MPASIIFITENSIVFASESQGTGTTVGICVPKTKVTFNFRVDSNNTILAIGQPLLEISFFENGKTAPFVKFTNEQYKNDESLNPSFIPIDGIDHTKDPMDIVTQIYDVIHTFGAKAINAA